VELHRVARLGEQAVHELDVRRVVLVVELVGDTGAVMIIVPPFLTSGEPL
jgi:hypothetical protein